MALASQTARMTSNRSYMMSNTSRRRRRAQRRNLAVAVIGIGGAVFLLGWLLMPGSEQAPPTDTLAPGGALTGADAGVDGARGRPAGVDAAATRASESDRTPSQSQSAAVLPNPTSQPARTPVLPDPQPIVRNERAAPSNAAVIEMGAPVVAPEPAQREPVVQTPPPVRETALPVRATSGAISDLFARADALADQGKPVEARDILNRALFDPASREADRDALRARIERLNETIVFGRTVVPGDKVTGSYTIGAGDSLARIASRENLDIDWRLLATINSISDPRRIRVGQSIKTLQGPFHAVVYKSRFRLDLYAGATDSAGNRLFIRSFPVGLGEYGSTPTGAFVVRPSSKLVNPAWVNPRTGEQFAADNPANPIGEHWIGLDPADDATASFTQYGLHGTIEPDSVGREMSMGCVRLGADDIALLYGFLVESKSTVDILP